MHRDVEKFGGAIEYYFEILGVYFLGHTHFF